MVALLSDPAVSTSTLAAAPAHDELALPTAPPDSRGVHSSSHSEAEGGVVHPAAVVVDVTVVQPHGPVVHAQTGANSSELTLRCSPRCALTAVVVIRGTG